MPKVAFYTLGCKLNFSETSTSARDFVANGYQKVELEDKPDVFVINTCSVTENADKKCKALVNKANRLAPDAFVVIIGCYAQLKPEDIAAIHGVDLVLGATEKFNIPAYLDRLDKTQAAQIHSCEIHQANEFHPSWSSGDRTRTFFKIQDGCDYVCTYCTIPLARGTSRSQNVEQTFAAIEKTIKAERPGEIVLTGVNTGDFGRAYNEKFIDLIRKLDTINEAVRFRISSIEPNLLSNEIIEFVAQSNRFVPHFHIPLQSGSNEILRKMKRRYMRELYTERVKKIRECITDCCIGVDVIVGFPGETEEAFLETYTFLRDLDINYLHVFTYSERPNTPAAEMEDVVPDGIRARRSRMLHILSDKKKRQFYEANIGRQYPVLWEAEKDENWMYGFTPNYLKMQTAWDESLVNKTCMAELQRVTDACTGMAMLCAEPVQKVFS
ncbi:MAG: tRNA (N(6)-L-threonylcarbamoyladenosine(37)-C(2))-methylthiotransferase MtaB [Bacteroidia bacterium]|nr:tRNA (N(6)-L-threonylcarbamoyladenosine(37)-C(2))-methylthiotransferase MtaB [Bacteroidia bacterium]